MLEFGLRQLHFYAGALIRECGLFFYVFLRGAIHFAESLYVFIRGFERALRLEELVVRLLSLNCRDLLLLLAQLLLA